MIVLTCVWDNPVTRVLIVDNDPWFRRVAQRALTSWGHDVVGEAGTAAEALRLAELSYREGRASLIELIDIQNAYTASRSSLTEARLELAIATAELGRILAQ